MSPVTLDLSKATPIDLGQGVSLDLSQAVPLSGNQSTAQPKQPPGFLKRLAQSLGVPTSMQELQQAQPSTAEQIIGPAATAGKMLWNYGKTAARGISEGLQESREAGENVGEGQPLGPNLGKAASGVLHAGLQATPIVGPSIETAGQDIQSGNYQGAAGGLTGVTGQVLAPELLNRGAAAVNKLRGNVADAAADSALGVTRLDRRRLPAGEKNAIGGTALDQLSGNSPEALADQAQAKVADLSQQIDNLATNSNAPVSLKPALDTLDRIEATADAQNDAASLKVVDKVRKQLTQKYRGGAAIPEITTARQALDLKRGVGKLKNWDSASEAAAASPIIDQVYGALDGELDQALPGSQGLNQQLSLMMKVSDRAEALLNSPGVLQNAINRIARPTGGLIAPTGVGAGIGFAAGGPVGAAVGGTVGSALGPFAQEAAVSPTARMALARGLKPGPPTPFGSRLAAARLAAGQAQPDQNQPDADFWQEASAEYRKRHGKL